FPAARRGRAAHGPAPRAVLPQLTSPPAPDRRAPAVGSPGAPDAPSILRSERPNFRPAEARTAKRAVSSPVVRPCRQITRTTGSAMMRHPRLWMGLLVGVLHSSAWGAWDVNMPRGATEVSRSVFDLHMTIFWICVVIGVLVFSVMIWSSIVHRRSVNPQPAHFHENTRVEVLWTVIPLLILIGMAVPATSTLIDIYDTSESDVDIQVTGYQWKWHYKYLGEDVEFFSNLTTTREQMNNLAPKGEHYLLEVDNPLVVPVGAKVRFLITAADV